MIQTGTELAQACVHVAKNYKTLYVKGCFGAPLTAENKARWKREQAYNQKADRVAKLDAADANTFGFDCVCFIKGLLWGWSGKSNHGYGGAQYAANGVPDIGETQMINACAMVSTDFSDILPGEAVWLPGHIGVYVGDGLVAECTPAWSDGVQLTACNREITGYPRRDWIKHGRLPWLTYRESSAAESPGFPRQLQKGSRGEDVRAMQILLVGRGVKLPQYGADGDFGVETEAAVKEYQRANGLIQDGICGKRTWTKLLGQ